MAEQSVPLRLSLGDRQSVSALLLAPSSAIAALVLAHGAGAGMEHPFMEHLATSLASHGVATLRFQFPFMENGSKRPDAAPVAQRAVRAAVNEATGRLPGVPLFAGGKSFGGRMASQAQAESPMPHMRGLAFFAFPLHPAGKPATERAGHLARVRCPMLFHQGTRDALADLRLMREVVNGLGERATLRIVDDADHAFHVRLRSGSTDAQVVDAVARSTAEWMRTLIRA